MVDELVETVGLKSVTTASWWRKRWSRSWWWTLLLTPAVALWSGALKDLHSDYLQWILQTQNNPLQQLSSRIFYWPQLLLAWSWNLELTARLNVLLRVGSVVFCLLWCSRLVAHVLQVKWWNLGVGISFFAIWWSLWWPEFGDSLMYSGTSLGTFVFLACLGDPDSLESRLQKRWSSVWLVIASLVATATYVHSLLVLAPITLWVALSTPTLSNSSRLKIVASVAAGGGVAIARLVLSRTEETGWTTHGLLTNLRTTRHLWDGTQFLYDNLGIAIVVLAATCLMSWQRRDTKAFSLGILGFVISLGVVPIATLKHVQSNLMMPRYFAAQLTIGLLIQLLAACVLVLSMPILRKSLRFPQIDGTRFVLIVRRAIGAVALSTLIPISITQLEFGRAYGDQSGNHKRGSPLTHEVVTQIRVLQRENGLDVVVNMGFWDLYPSVFQLQRAGVRASALEGESIFDRYQKEFADIISTRRFLGVCVPRFDTCVPEFGNLLLQRKIKHLDIQEIDHETDSLDRTITVLEVARTD